MASNNQFEEWRDIPDYEGLYQVSNLGRVRATPRVKSLTPSYQNGRLSQLVTSLTKEGITTQVGVHRLVLLAFDGECPDECEGCHKDGDVTNNDISNLYWGTSQDNSDDAIRHGTTRAISVKRSDGKVYRSLTEAAEDTGCDRQNISHVCDGKRKTAGGFGWTRVG